MQLQLMVSNSHRFFACLADVDGVVVVVVIIIAATVTHTPFYGGGELKNQVIKLGSDSRERISRTTKIRKAKATRAPKNIDLVQRHQQHRISLLYFLLPSDRIHFSFGDRLRNVERREFLFFNQEYFGVPKSR